MTILPSRISSPRRRISAIVAGGGRDRLHHRHQTAFDTLGDLDFAFTREQFDRAHFAHVHAHRVGRAAELAVHGGQGGFGFFFGFFLGGRRGAGVVEQQRLGVRRLFVHRHAHVVEHGDHDLQRFGIDQFVGQVVGDFAMRQVTARLAQFDQRLQALAALDQVLFGQDGLIQAEFLHQGPFLGLADLHAQRLDLFAIDEGRFLRELGHDVLQVLQAIGGSDRALGFGASFCADSYRGGGECHRSLGWPSGLFLDCGFSRSDGRRLLEIGTVSQGFLVGLEGAVGDRLGGWH